MSVNIKVNDEKEVYGDVNGKQFLVYKDMITPLTSTCDLAVIELANELAALRAERDEAVQHLTSVISWIGNWEPDFRDDSEWIEEEKIITDFLSKVQS